MPDLPRTLHDIFKLPRVLFVDRGLLPSAPGLYFALYEAKEVRLAYVGKADNLRMRWTGHHREGDLSLLTALHIPVELAYLEAPKESLAAIEDSMIKLFSPPLNQRYARRELRPQLSIPKAAVAPTVTGIIQEYRLRRDNAIELLASDEFWDICNGDDGDLFAVWSFESGAELVNVNDFWMYNDNHRVHPSRIPTPPAIAADNSGHVQPAPNYVATSEERTAWIFQVADQVDAWLVAVANWHASGNKSVLKGVQTALMKEKRVVDLLAFP